MSTPNPTGTAPASDAPAQDLVLQNIYVKDASFEAPSGPNLQVTEWNPQFNLNMNTTGSTLAENVHEVVLTITLEAKIADKVAYLVEVKQGGLFHIRGYSEDEARRIVGSFCPGVLFPYARQSVSDLILRGGFPPFLLPPVNFDALFQQSLEQAARQTPPPAVN
ncbi:MAG: protein-export chaperone SecB [Proteobacteria bacterium]|nr:protein-export chaperone SecB [Pseudomonadota bacterium]